MGMHFFFSIKYFEAVFSIAVHLALGGVPLHYRGYGGDKLSLTRLMVQLNRSSPSPLEMAHIKLLINCYLFPPDSTFLHDCRQSSHFQHEKSSWVHQP